jgi:hypothetical protein
MNTNKSVLDEQEFKGCSILAYKDEKIFDPISIESCCILKGTISLTIV